MFRLSLLSYYFKNNKYRITKFCISGLLSALINLVLLLLLVNYLNFNTVFLENIANILSMEISIIFNFIISRNWTWSDIEREQGKGLFKQAFIFHLIV